MGVLPIGAPFVAFVFVKSSLNWLAALVVPTVIGGTLLCIAAYRLLQKMAIFQTQLKRTTELR
jgi:hypothetical protein